MARAFVIQGFGKKVDFQQQKTFDLDSSYAIIREAMSDIGVECHRADEFPQVGVMDLTMYRELLSADLVIADITTLNFNAAYELGVRYALRPRSTIVIGESKLNFPFDINHIYVNTYVHLGEDVGHNEAMKFRKHLAQLAAKVLKDTAGDSPVYHHLKGVLPEAGFMDLASASPETAGTTLRAAVQSAQTFMGGDNFAQAVVALEEARKLAPKDDYVTQQLALATYKSKLPTPTLALHKAREILRTLQPHTSYDSETLGLWAAVHKRLLKLEEDPNHLTEAIFALERGFFIRKSFYVGINLAFMLDVRAVRQSGAEREESRAVARYVRRESIKACEESMALETAKGDDQYWAPATLYEAYVGLGNDTAAAQWDTARLAVATAHP